MYHPPFAGFQNATNNNNGSAQTNMIGMLQSQPQQQQSMGYFPIFPTPTAAPWNIDSMPWKLCTRSSNKPAENNMFSDSGVRQFQGHGNLPMDELERRMWLHQKRKSEALPIETPTKQFISEEKITAHFNGLHISSDYIESTSTSTSTEACGADNKPQMGKSFTNLSYEDYQITAKELEQKLINANRITLCDQVKELTEKDRKVSYLPEALLNRTEKPCKALVLWQPPPPIVAALKAQDQVEEGENNDNQNESRDSSNTSTPPIDPIDVDLPDDEDDDDDNIDDFVDNNNTCGYNFNNVARLPEDDLGMDEDL